MPSFVLNIINIISLDDAFINSSVDWSSTVKVMACGLWWPLVFSAQLVLEAVCNTGSVQELYWVICATWVNMLAHTTLDLICTAPLISQHHLSLNYKKDIPWLTHKVTGISLGVGMCPANERRRYNLTTSLIGWVLASANGVAASSTLARLQHRWWKGPFKLVVKTFIDDGTSRNLSKLFKISPTYSLTRTPS